MTIWPVPPQKNIFFLPATQEIICPYKFIAVEKTFCLIMTTCTKKKNTWVTTKLVTKITIYCLLRAISDMTTSINWAWLSLRHFDVTANYNWKYSTNNTIKIAYYFQWKNFFLGIGSHSLELLVRMVAVRLFLFLHDNTQQKRGCKMIF